MSPSTGDAASVTTPGGSAPLGTRASHSQPTRLLPTFVEPPTGWVSRPVLRQTRSWPCAALTRSGKYPNGFWPMNCTPVRAFSGELAPAGSRHVPVWMPLGSGPPLWLVL